jgi:hypothetical protein
MLDHRVYLAEALLIVDLWLMGLLSAVVRKK